MKFYELIPIIIFCMLTAALICMKLCGVGSRKRGIVKMLASSFFLVGAAYSLVRLGTAVLLPAIGLICAFLGDLFLVFMDDHRFFVAGTLSFCASSTCFCLHAFLAHQWQWWFCLVFIVIFVGNALCQVKGVYSYGRDKVVLNAYILLVGLCGSLGLTVAFSAENVFAVLFGIGCFCYFVSDLCLGLYLLKFRLRWLDSLNTLLYFPGILLIVMSLL